MHDSTRSPIGDKVAASGEISRQLLDPEADYFRTRFVALLIVTQLAAADVVTVRPTDDDPNQRGGGRYWWPNANSSDCYPSATARRHAGGSGAAWRP